MANNENNASFVVSLFLDPDISGDVDFEYVDDDRSIASYAELSFSTNGISNLSSLEPFYEFVAGPESSRMDDITDLKIVSGVGRSILIAVKSVGNVNVASSVTINWFEQQ